MPLERDFQAKLIRELRERYPLPDGLVMKVDPIQGLPDILILYRGRWAALECKRCAGAHHQPNQDYYVDVMNHMSFARFIFPENKEEVLNELQQALEP